MQLASRRFLLWYGLGGIGVFVGVPVLVQFVPPAVADRVEVGWFLSIPILALVGVIAVRRAGKSDKRTVPRVATLLSVIVILMWLLTVFAIPQYADYTTKAKVQEGLSLSSPHRTAVSIACAEGTLREGMGAVELGLGDEPSTYTRDYVTHLDLQVTDNRTVEIVVRYREIRGKEGLGFISPERTVVHTGDTVVFTGHCAENDMEWTVSGSVPERYRPRL